MSDSLRKDPKSLRTCILYEVIRGKSVEKAYKNVCKAFGNNAISYIDFDYLFYRFYNGNHDLDYDKGRDPKSLLLSDLPADAIGKVVEKLELKEQLTLRKVSHDFQFLVDEQKLGYEKVHLRCGSDNVFIQFNDHEVVYRGFTGSNHILLGGWKEIRSDKEDIFVEMAFNDLAIALKNPKLKLESIYLDYEISDDDAQQEIIEKNYEGMKKLLNSVNHKISVNSLSMPARCQKEVLTILSHLKPCYLEKINIVFLSEIPCIPPKLVKFDQIITLDQWKQAKSVELNTSVSAPIESFLHFQEFEVEIDSDITETLIRLRDGLSKSTEFRYCSLSLTEEADYEDYKPVLELIENDDNSWIGHYSITGTDENLEFECSRFEVYIRRTSNF